MGKHMKQASQLIMAFDQNQIAELESAGKYNIEIEGQAYELAMDDFEITAEEIPGWQVAQDGEITVALDINLTDELIAEGMARELVNRIQNIRKDQDFDVTDRINIAIQEHESIVNAVSGYGDYIKAEVLADEITIGSESDGQSVELPGELSLKISVERVN